MKYTTLLMSILTLSFAAPAFADQCAYIQIGEASYSRRILSNHESVFQFCPMCGDKTPKKAMIGRERSGDAALHFRKRSEGPKNKSYWEVVLNEKAISGPRGSAKIPTRTALDLAYTYVKTGGNTLTNLAWMVGCDSLVEAEPFIDLRGEPQRN
jgi:hypothetical protein